MELKTSGRLDMKRQPHLLGVSITLQNYNKFIGTAKYTYKAAVAS
jgi:hypothetical protein